MVENFNKNKIKVIEKVKLYMKARILEISIQFLKEFTIIRLNCIF